MKMIAKDCYEPVFQGDVMVMRIRAEDVPADVKKLDTDVIAHSETGHHHVAKYADVLGGLNPMVMFLKAKQEHVDVVHLRDYDTHETYRFFTDPGDMFIIKRQREQSPQGWRRVED
jgi:hypothetical protein